MNDYRKTNEIVEGENALAYRCPECGKWIFTMPERAELTDEEKRHLILEEQRAMGEEWKGEEAANWADECWVFKAPNHVSCDDCRLTFRTGHMGMRVDQGCDPSDPLTWRLIPTDGQDE